MKKLLILFLLTLSVSAMATGRPSDRDWTVSQIAVSGNVAERVTQVQSGKLRVQSNGAKSYIAFNATANATDWVLADGVADDFYPGSINLGDYFTVFSASNVTINYIILD